MTNTNQIQISEKKQYRFRLPALWGNIVELWNSPLEMVVIPLVILLYVLNEGLRLHSTYVEGITILLPYGIAWHRISMRDSNGKSLKLITVPLIQLLGAVWGWPQTGWLIALFVALIER